MAAIGDPLLQSIKLLSKNPATGQYSLTDYEYDEETTVRNLVSHISNNHPQVPDKIRLVACFTNPPNKDTPDKVIGDPDELLIDVVEGVKHISVQAFADMGMGLYLSWD